MSVNNRLKALEKVYGVKPDGPWDWQRWQAYHDDHAAYLRGNGPRPADPPTPPGHDPEVWASRLRISAALDSIIVNGDDVALVVWPEGTTAEEKRELLELIELCQQVQRDIPTGVIGPPPEPTRAQE